MTRSPGLLAALLIAAGLGLAACGARADGPPAGATDSQERLRVLEVHHAHLNSVDVEAALAWYETVWPTGARGEIAGHPAFVTEMPLLFNEVVDPPAGAFDTDARRSMPQSPIWHIGAFVNTTGLFEELARGGVEVVDLYVGPDGANRVARSGLAPYAGIATAAQLDTVRAAEPRDGGFGYLLGPDGVLFELTGGPNTTPSLSHVHLFHEQPRCAANWYVDVLGMTLPPRRLSGSDQPVSHERWDACDEGEPGPAGWPSLERVGTLRSPNARVVFEGGSFSTYPRQCQEGRCDEARPLVTSNGQVVDHIAFSVTSLDAWPAHLERLGVTVLQPPRPFGPGRAMVIEGPDGIIFELVEGT